MDVAGAGVTPELSVADVAEVRLPTAVAPEATVDLQIAFTTTIPRDPRQSYGMFGFHPAEGTYALAHWEPLPGRLRPDRRLEPGPAERTGRSGLHQHLALRRDADGPDDLTVITTGTETGAEAVADGQTGITSFPDPPATSSWLLTTTSNRCSQDVGGTTVRSWYSPDDVASGRDVLHFGAQALAVYSRLFGAYPYAEMDIVEVDLRNAGGIEFPQITFIEAGHYDQRGGNTGRGSTSWKSMWRTSSATSGGTVWSATTSTSTPSSTRGSPVT